MNKEDCLKVVHFMLEYDCPVDDEHISKSLQYLFSPEFMETDYSYGNDNFMIKGYYKVVSLAWETAKRLTHDVNGYGTDNERLFAEEFVKTIGRTHRTLQASALRVIFKTLKEYGKKATFDGRNEAAVKSCNELDYCIPLV